MIKIFSHFRNNEVACKTSATLRQDKHAVHNLNSHIWEPYGSLSILGPSSLTLLLQPPTPHAIPAKWPFPTPGLWRYHAPCFGCHLCSASAYCHPTQCGAPSSKSPEHCLQVFWAWLLTRLWTLLRHRIQLLHFSFLDQAQPSLQCAQKSGTNWKRLGIQELSEDRGTSWWWHWLLF